MLEKNVQEAIVWWQNENAPDSHHLTSTIPWLFKTGEALYKSIQLLGTGRSAMKLPIHMSGTSNRIINLEISPSDYFHLRGILAMVADLYRISTSIKKLGDVESLNSSIKTIQRNSNRFRDIRNFFEHIDDRLINIQDHGISEEMVTDCGIVYGEGTNDCFHLVFDGTSFHFTDDKKAKVRSFTKHDFYPIFEGLEDLYEQITKHQTVMNDYDDFLNYINYKTLTD